MTDLRFQVNAFLHDIIGRIEPEHLEFKFEAAGLDWQVYRFKTDEGSGQIAINLGEADDGKDRLTVGYFKVGQASLETVRAAVEASQHVPGRTRLKWTYSAPHDPVA